MGRKPVFLGFRHVFHGEQLSCLEKTLQLGYEIICLCWIEYYSALGKLQFILYKFRYRTYRLIASISSILFLPRFGYRWAE